MGRVFVNGEEQEEAGQSEDSGAGQHLREVIAGERDAVAAYLRRVAREYEKHAAHMLADTMQSKPEADRVCFAASILIEQAGAIQNGRHWR
jgi:hypothetical protein